MSPSNVSLVTKERDQYETKTLNSGDNYSRSPAARHAMKDGSLDPSKHHLDITFNRKMRMRDTFTVLFPGYQHGNYSNCSPKNLTSNQTYQYPQTNEIG